MLRRIDTEATAGDPITGGILGVISGGRPGVLDEPHPGVYEIAHFSLEHLLPFKVEEFFEFPNEDGGPFDCRECYGVCDNVQQILDHYPELQSSEDREFVVGITRIRKEEQPEWGGWRWHKWGEYIGTQSPQCEYIHDEPEIEEVFVFHIYEVVRG